MATFDNPNSPVQPQKGVYTWHAERNGESIAIYVGRAGTSTLYRGVCQLCRDILDPKNNPSFSSVDTNFVVGTAIRYFESKEYSCLWRHIDDEPNNELRHVQQERPFLQDLNGKIKREYKMRKNEVGYWERQGGGEVERELFSLFERSLSVRNNT